MNKNKIIGLVISIAAIAVFIGPAYFYIETESPIKGLLSFLVMLFGTIIGLFIYWKEPKKS